MWERRAATNFTVRRRGRASPTRGAQDSTLRPDQVFQPVSSSSGRRCSGEAGLVGRRPAAGLGWSGLRRALVADRRLVGAAGGGGSAARTAPRERPARRVSPASGSYCCLDRLLELLLGAGRARVAQDRVLGQVGLGLLLALRPRPRRPRPAGATPRSARLAGRARRTRSARRRCWPPRPRRRRPRPARRGRPGGPAARARAPASRCWPAGRGRRSSTGAEAAAGARRALGSARGAGPLRGRA